MTGVIFFLFSIVLVLGIFELTHNSRPYSPLVMKPFEWKVNENSTYIETEGWLEISNPHNLMEVMVPNIEITTKLLSRSKIDDVNIETIITPFHQDEEARQDNYWAAYIVKPKKKTNIKVNITLKNKDYSEATSIPVENISIEIKWQNYGPFGKLYKVDQFVIPIKKPKVIKTVELDPKTKYSLIPIKTHLLGTLDNVVDVVSHYVSGIKEHGDILAIGETPLAIMQGRYLHPSNINPSWLSKVICRGFHPTSSLATACGMQTLIDVVGPTRVILAWIVGGSLKLIRIKGIFYRLAGEQARLIDDITGTTPPYDQTIVLGPTCTQIICEEISTSLGIHVAIVDVNDLGKVKILASSKSCNRSILQKSLRSNPAGNANEQTPLVLIRPSKKL